MNDFTKEELKAILWYIVTPISIPPGNTLVPKIQDLISKFCEHHYGYNVENAQSECMKYGVKNE